MATSKSWAKPVLFCIIIFFVCEHHGTLLGQGLLLFHSKSEICQIWVFLNTSNADENRNGIKMNLIEYGSAYLHRMKSEIKVT